MASVEDQIAALKTAAASPDDKSHALFTKALASKRGYLVGEAAKLTVRAGLDELYPLFRKAFVRLTQQGAKRDPRCLGKVAILQAIDYAGEHHGFEDLFELGARYRQPEPTWGGSEDGAAELRGIATLGLVRLQHPRAMVHIADLLADGDKVARMAGVQALRYSGNDLVAEPLLRLRIAVGEPDPQVLTELFVALLDVGPPEESLAFAVEFLHHEESHYVEAVALALGESRREDVAAPLSEALESEYPGRPDAPERWQTLLVALAMLRQPAAWQRLHQIIESGPHTLAEEAARALAVYRHDDKIARELQQAAEARDERWLLDLVAELLD